MQCLFRRRASNDVLRVFTYLYLIYMMSENRRLLPIWIPDWLRATIEALVTCDHMF